MTTQLYWDEGGAIACEAHRPYPGSDTDAWGQWRPITIAERVDFESELGHPPACETCAAIQRNRKKTSDH